jgi:N-acetylglucosamine malate deacetylase 1
MRVLAVGAHPDDLEILAGGTLARFARSGDEVVMCHATTGNRGSFVHAADEIAAIRLDEARRAAEVIGAQHVTLGLDDGEVSSADPEHKRRVVDLVRDARPDLIITHHPQDCMGDHYEVSKLVFECSIYATLPLWETDRPRHHVVTPIYYMDTVFGIGFVPASTSTSGQSWSRRWRCSRRNGEAMADRPSSAV